jgi:hypothetical protein
MAMAGQSGNNWFSPFFLFPKVRWRGSAVVGGCLKVCQQRGGLSCTFITRVKKNTYIELFPLWPSIVLGTHVNTHMVRVHAMWPWAQIYCTQARTGQLRFIYFVRTPNNSKRRAPIEGQTGQNYLHGFLLRAVNRGRDKDCEKGPKPSNCLKPAVYSPNLETGQRRSVLGWKHIN